MNFYKIAAGLSLALLLSSGFSGCGGSSSGEPEGFKNDNQDKLKMEDSARGLLDDNEVILKDDNGVEIARVNLAKGTKVESKDGENRCACKPQTKCTPCALKITRSCGSEIDTAEKTDEAQNEFAGSNELALLSATYDIKVNKAKSGDIVTKDIKVKLKIPKCIHDKATDTYFNYKDGGVRNIKIWIQPDGGTSERTQSNNGYWLEKSFTADDMSDGYIDFIIEAPAAAINHIALFGIVKNPSATGATGTGGA